MSTLKEDFEILDPAEEIQKAYDGANIESPWTPARQSAALSMGCKLLNGVICQELQEFMDTGAYPNVYRDIVIFSWLSGLSPEEVNKINARLNIETATAAAFEWAEKENLAYGSQAYLTAMSYFSKTALHVLSSLYSVEKERSDPFSNGKTGTPRPGKSRSVSKPRRQAVNLPVT